jgi:hypothetical protein
MENPKERGQLGDQDMVEKIISNNWMVRGSGKST